ncbi:hypothetical protein KCP78_06735 [Salmonella enterica subsp. enterica]|nr:hypothetical protein KCP78_06735 [Salmonella enterica subsp. enterica]
MKSGLRRAGCTFINWAMTGIGRYHRSGVIYAIHWGIGDVPHGCSRLGALTIAGTMNMTA